MRNKNIIIAILILSVQTSLSAQIGFSLETESGYADNIYSNYRMIPDTYQRLNGFLHFDRTQTSAGIRFFYRTSMNHFKKVIERNYSNHTIGLTAFRYLNESGSKINAGVELRNRMHSDVYHWYELKDWYGYLNVKLILTGQLYGYSGLQMHYKSYTSLSPFSHWQQTLFLRLSRFFQTGTTLILETDLLSKTYLNEGEPGGVENLPNIVTLGDGSSYQAVAMIKAAQAISSQTGLSSSLLFRSNLKSSVRYLGTSENVYYSDEEIFDDVYGYRSSEFDLTLRQHLPWQIKVTLNSSWMDKTYEQRLALDLEGNPFDDQRIRQDQRWVAWASIEKSIRFSQKLQPLILSIEYRAIRNSSNDPYYNYNRNLVSFRISQVF